jgi:phosphoesterase RecJ-like protein
MIKDHIISFRSQGSFDVNQFARNHFNGGGHINATGGKSYDSLEKTIEKFESILSKTTI